MRPMDEVLARKLSRQLRLLNFLIVFFALIFMVLFAIAGLFAYKAVQEVRDAKNSLTSVQQQATDTLNVRDDLCNTGGSLGSLLKSQSDVCN